MARTPVFRISVTNATGLSAAYLLLASVLEGVRRAFGFRWAEVAALSMESFPARLLSFVGLYDPLRRAWIEGRLNDTQVRLIYGGTVVLMVFALGMLVGVLMWLLQRVTMTPPPES